MEPERKPPRTTTRVPNRNLLQTQGLPTRKITTREAPHKQSYRHSLERHESLSRTKGALANADGLRDTSLGAGMLQNKQGFSATAHLCTIKSRKARRTNESSNRYGRENEASCSMGAPAHGPKGGSSIHVALTDVPPSSQACCLHRASSETHEFFIPYRQALGNRASKRILVAACLDSSTNNIAWRI